MDTIVVTGFMPFGGETMNPAWEAVSRLPDTVCGKRIITAEVPVSYAGSWQVLKEKIDQWAPKAVVLVGQAGGRATVTVEKYGRNIMDCKVPDSDGVVMEKIRIDEAGEERIRSALSMHCENEFVMSDDAGGYICNCLYYHALRYFAGESVFIHVPYCEMSLGIRDGSPYMKMDDIASAVRRAVEIAAENVLRSW